jgi:hypothetical protein
MSRRDCALVEPKIRGLPKVPLGTKHSINKLLFQQYLISMRSKQASRFRPSGRCVGSKLSLNVA